MTGFPDFAINYLKQKITYKFPMMSESTFPAAPLVRPPMMVRNLMASSHLGAASAAVAPGAPDGAAAAACQGSLAGFAEPGTTGSSVVWRQLSLEAGSARSA